MTGALDVAKELFLSVVSIIVPLFAVLILAILGWYLVWKLFLSRFRFVRELLGSMGETPTHTATHGDSSKTSISSKSSSKNKPRKD